MRLVAEKSSRPATGRKPLIGTAQQEAFWQALQDRSGHLVLEARAGTGKSSSAREGMWRIKDRHRQARIRYCCFNRAIADEFARDCPPGIDVGTLHAFGYQALRAMGRKPVLDAKKNAALLAGMPAAERLDRSARSCVLRYVSLAKNFHLDPDSDDLPERIASLALHLGANWDEVDGPIVDTAARLFRQSVHVLNRIDFDDMLYLPVSRELPFPSLDYLFIDEAQDLNAIQHALVARMTGAGRTIVIGDPYQAIYAFRGADANSIDRLRGHLDADTLSLTVSFRCPRSHVARARLIVSDFEAAPGAPEGEILFDNPDAILSARPGDFVLCRMNAPILRYCLRTLSRGKPAVMRGRAIGQNLETVLRRVGDVATIAQFRLVLNAWLAREIQRYRDRGDMEAEIEMAEDRAGCLMAIAETCGSPSEIPTAINRLFTDEPGRSVVFSSIHRAKGSEADRVFLLDIPYTREPRQDWEHDQRRNLRYVALTRSRQSLWLLNPSPSDR